MADRGHDVMIFRPGKPPYRIAITLIVFLILIIALFAIAILFFLFILIWLLPKDDTDSYCVVEDTCSYFHNLMLRLP